MYQQLQDAKNSIEKILIQKKIKRPQVGIILGSGLGAFSQKVDSPVEIPFSDIPHFHNPSVEGHAGKLIFGTIDSGGEKINVVLQQGRLHYYEGHSMHSVVLPVRVMGLLGIQSLLVTNAAGGINSTFREADLMMIVDHINLGHDNPLRGANIKELGPRFPDMTQAYDPESQEIIRAAAIRLGLNLKEGIYTYYPGPTYETPSEIRMMRILGSDAIGMSTVPEVIAAHHMGIRVAAISCITNLGAGMTMRKLTHEEVIENANKAASKLMNLAQECLAGFMKLSSNSRVKS